MKWCWEGASECLPKKHIAFKLIYADIKIKHTKTNDHIFKKINICSAAPVNHSEKKTKEKRQQHV